MPDDNASNMTWFERHVVDSLERLEHNQEKLEGNQQTYIADFRKHTEADATAFEAVRTDVAMSKAEHAGAAKATARMWAAIATGVSLIASTIVHFLAHK